MTQLLLSSNAVTDPQLTDCPDYACRRADVSFIGNNSAVTVDLEPSWTDVLVRRRIATTLQGSHPHQPYLTRRHLARFRALRNLRDAEVKRARLVAEEAATPDLLDYDE